MSASGPVLYNGALHLFQSLMTIMDAGEEPTDADLSKMEMIDIELRQFGRDFELRSRQGEGFGMSKRNAFDSDGFRRWVRRRWRKSARWIPKMKDCRCCV